MDTEKQRVAERNGPVVHKPQKSRSPSEGPRKRGRLPNEHNAKKPGSFQRGRNSHTAEPHRRGPDRIPRGSVRLLFRTLLDDQGDLEQMLEGDESIRANILRLYARAIREAAMSSDPAVMRSGMAAVNDIADRLEGKPVAKVDAQVYPQAIFYQAGTPPPPGIDAPKNGGEPEFVRLEAR